MNRGSILIHATGNIGHIALKTDSLKCLQRIIRCPSKKSVPSLITQTEDAGSQQVDHLIGQALLAE